MGESRGLVLIVDDERDLRTLLQFNLRQAGYETAHAASGAEALALLEVASLARGVVAADAVAKQAQVELLECSPVSPGKYLILFAGGVAEVDESLRAGAAVPFRRPCSSTKPSSPRFRP